MLTHHHAYPLLRKSVRLLTRSWVRRLPVSRQPNTPTHMQSRSLTLSRVLSTDRESRHSLSEPPNVNMEQQSKYRSWTHEQLVNRVKELEHKLTDIGVDALRLVLPDTPSHLIHLSLSTRVRQHLLKI